MTTKKQRKNILRKCKNLGGILHENKGTKEKYNEEM